MAAPTFLALVAGVYRSITASVTAAPNVIVATGPGSYIDPSFMPPGVGSDIAQAYPTESIAAGAPVNLYTGTVNSTSALCARNADSATPNTGKKISGFAITALTASTTTTSSIYRSGPASGQTGLTIGSDYYLGPAGTYVLATAGSVTSPASGTTVQYAGTAVSATVLDVQPGPATAVN